MFLLNWLQLLCLSFLLSPCKMPLPKLPFHYLFSWQTLIQISVLMIQILATVHHCVHFTLQVVPFLCSNFPIVRAKQMTSWKWQGMRKSKHISFNCSVQTKSLNNNDISCQIIIYLYNEKNPGYCISSLLLRVIISLTSLLSGTMFLYLKLWVFSSQGIRYWGMEAL